MSTNFLKVKNNALSSLASGITNSATSLSVVAGEGSRFPSDYPFHVSIDDEILECSNRSTDTFTVSRAAESTSAVLHSAGAPVALTISAQVITDLQDGKARTATIVVAASNATTNSKLGADYVCDGTADNVEIQAAIDALPSGGLLYLSEGTFNLASALNIGNGSITIRGANTNATHILATSSITNMLTKTTGANRLVIEDVKFDCNAGTATNGVNLTDAVNGAYLLRLNRVTVNRYSGYGFIMDGNEDSVLDQCIAENPSGSGKSLKWQVPSGNILVSNSFLAADTELAGQIARIFGTTLAGVRAIGQLIVLDVTGCYFNRALSTNILIDAGSTGIRNLEVSSCVFGFIATGDLLAGNFTNKVALKNNWISAGGGGTVTVLPSSPTLYGNAISG